MDLDGNTFTIIEYRNLVLFSINRHLECVHGRVVDLHIMLKSALGSQLADCRTHLVVSGIDENLIEDLEETRNIGYLLQGHSLGCFVVDPHLGLQVLDRSDIGIRSFQDMFQLRQLSTRYD